jgi:hypothetical protein
LRRAKELSAENRTRKTDDYYDDVPPDASAMVESMRAHGYTFATAIADLIDNSIAAKCRNVWLRFEWEGPDSWVSVTDDGNGMAEDELVGAMRLGSTSPLTERDPADLGRFGLGLKTASFSQARRLTVRSKSTGGADSIRRWDLDFLARPETRGWQLLRTAHGDTGERINELDRLGLETGTEVLLEIMDRVVGGSEDKTMENHFVRVARVRDHLAMVFHRFLSDTGDRKLFIRINGDEIKAWDPFVRYMKATQTIVDEPFPADNTTADFTDVRIKGFVLPHKDRFIEKYPNRGSEMHRRASGPDGWNAQQGFYLYRNRRLIVAGSWLGLGPGRNGWKQEEHYKLARIRVDISNATDQEWQIDVKKSTASPPPVLRGWLESHAKKVREEAKAVYSHRGGYGNRGKKPHLAQTHPWVCTKRDGDVFSYRIDRNNKVLKALIASLPDDEDRKLETLLRLVEETVPIQRIWIDTSENQDNVARPFEGEIDSKLRGHIRMAHRVLVEQGGDSQAAWSLINDFPAFQSSVALAIIAQLREEEAAS